MKKEAINKYLVLSNFILSILGAIILFIRSETAVEIMFFLFILLILSNIGSFVYLLAKKKKEYYIRRLLFIIFSIFPVIIGSFLNGVYKQIAFSGCSIILLFISLYFIWKI
jgi:hypothetical protein